MRRTARTSPQRRLGTALIILVVGGAIAIWSAVQSSRRTAEIEVFVTGLCEAAAKGESIAGRAPGSSLPVLGAVQASLTGMLEATPEVIEIIDVEVRPGDIEPYGDGHATHNAVVSLGGLPQLGLRLRHHNGAVTILGYWLPREAAP